MNINILDKVKIKMLEDNENISYEETDELYNATDGNIEALLDLSSQVTTKYHENGVYLCSIISARTGACSEDCRFCSQSIFNQPIYPSQPFIEPGIILNSAIEAEKSGASEFCIVSSGRGPKKGTIEKVIETVHLIRRNTNLEIGCSLGILTEEQAIRLADAGVRRYNHNLETSRNYFPHICSTHSYDDRINTARTVKQHGIQLCCGGILGLGESKKDRIDLAFTLRELEPEVVPINFLDPKSGSPLESRQLLDPLEALKIIAIFRLILPQSIIICAGGREKVLGKIQSLAIAAGANSLITGDYLTSIGDPKERDRKMVEKMGLSILKFS